MSKKTIKCKSCSNDVSSKAKVCPNCGSKIKKPIYKKWWFWLVIAILFIAVVSGGGDDENVAESGEPTTVVDETKAFEGDSAELTIGENTNLNAIEESKKEKKQTTTKNIVDKTEYKETIGKKNARKSAESYLRYSSFSREGLIDQLEYEKYSHEDAVYAVDKLEVDWNEQALKSAESYLNYSSFSYEGLVDQLEYEGFTSSEAKYGADNCGADWNEQAAKSAASYLEYSSFSKGELIDQLEYEGFTHEQAVYGVEAVGY